jgi:hypothetical protein
MEIRCHGLEHQTPRLLMTSAWEIICGTCGRKESVIPEGCLIEVRSITTGELREVAWRPEDRTQIKKAMTDPNSNPRVREAILAKFKAVREAAAAKE